MVESKFLTILGRLALHTLFGLGRDQSIIGRESLDILTGATVKGSHDYLEAEVWETVLLDVGAIRPAPWSEFVGVSDDFVIDFRQANRIRFALTTLMGDGLVDIPANRANC